MAKVVSVDLDKFVKEINAEIRTLENLVLDSGASDYASYRAKIGERKGLKKAAGILKRQFGEGDGDNDD